MVLAMRACAFNIKTNNKLIKLKEIKEEEELRTCYASSIPFGNWSFKEM